MAIINSGYALLTTPILSVRRTFSVLDDNIASYLIFPATTAVTQVCELS
ncbi:hypothetical protein BN1221_04006 [Brenneria goodwinii]|uniref:Uncharacterized protein n=1 Tax=Brenneria goodwinii TaxID=1109412 RepID=A0A0G4K0L4_9GAMM|nr:hypothetical protein BN1221_04006 [Brenneria goodwinii]